MSRALLSTGRSRSSLVAVASVAGLVTAFAPALPATAAPRDTVIVTQASGPSPFADCVQEGQGGTNYPDTELEPWVAVNPTDHSNIIGVWQQDRWSTGGAHGLVAGVTKDGGLSFTESWAKFSQCSGGEYERASDPWVTFAPNGDAYQISISWNEVENGLSAVLVSKSTDGGESWSDPVTVAEDDATQAPFFFHDKESITADPHDSDYVYAVWDRSRFPSDKPNFNALHAFSFRGDIMFSRTTDGGQTWEPARPIYAPRSNKFAIGNQIVVLPDGTLVDGFFLGQGSGNQRGGWSMAVILSSDRGETWTDPIIVQRKVEVVSVNDPDTGTAVRTGDIIPDLAVDAATGTLYAVWQDGRFSEPPRGHAIAGIAFSQSTDGGLTWSSPIQVNQAPEVQAFTGSVDVNSDGTVGVTYYDFRNNTPDPDLPTDYWMVHCDANCTNAASWSETHLYGPFDMELAPYARGLFVGDYEGLDHDDADFLALFAATTATDMDNTYLARVILA